MNAPLGRFHPGKLPYGIRVSIMLILAIALWAVLWWIVDSTL
jgi:hypothetical protein